MVDLWVFLGTRASHRVHLLHEGLCLGIAEMEIKPSAQLAGIVKVPLIGVEADYRTSPVSGSGHLLKMTGRTPCPQNFRQ